MKKIFSTLMAVVMILVLAITSVGCGGDTGVKIDKTKTQLYVSNLDLGVGRSYIESIGKAFEEKFKDKSFEEGKTGVQVLYNHNTNINGNAFYESMQSDRDNVYFTENVSYLQYAHKFMDVTDSINSPAVTGYDVASDSYTYESNTIASKIDNVMLTFLNRGTESAPVYRAFPFYLAIKSVNYNADLWNEKNFYLAKGGAPSEYVALTIAGKDNFANNAEYQAALTTAKQNYEIEMAKIKKGEQSQTWTFVDANGVFTITDENGNKTGTMDLGLSAGPDGVYDTFDDGFPATYDEFYALCDKMVASNVTPFIWTGANPGYADMLTQSLFTNDMGLERTKVYYSLNGTIDNLVKLQNGKIVTQDGKPVIDDPVTFTGGEENGYDAQRSISKLYALQFAEQIAKHPKWTISACYDSNSQSEAQNYYLKQGYTIKKKNKNAMLMDGAWWQQEANKTFEAMAKVDSKYAKENRNFGVLPLPSSTIDRFAEKAENKEKNVIVTENDSFCFINDNIDKNSPQYEVSRLFMSFFNSDDMAGLFTAKTNMLRAINVDLKNNEYWNQMSPYGQSFVEFGEGVEVMYPYTTNEFMNNNRSIFKNTRDAWQFHAYKEGVGEYSFPITGIKKFGWTAKDFFEGIYNYYTTIAWKQLNK